MKPRTYNPARLILLTTTVSIAALAFVLYSRATRQEEINQHLLNAVCNRDIKSVRSLLADGANPSVRFIGMAQTQQGRSYRLTVKATHSSIVEKLFSFFVKHKPIPQSGEPCIELAFSYANRATLSRRDPALDKEALGRLLLEHGADANATDSFGTTELANETYNDNVPIVRLLLEYGADPNYRLNGGETAMTRACVCDDVEIVKLLLDHGADIKQRSNDGRTLIQHVTHNGKEGKDIIKLLLEHGAPRK